MKPKLFALSGLPFSGKSTLAKKLSEALSVKILSYDHDIYAHHKNEVPSGTSPAKEYELVQAIAHKKLRSMLKSGESVIYDDLNLERTDREILISIAHDCNAQYYLIFVDTPLDIIEQRRKTNMQLPNRDHIDEAKMQLDISLLQRPRPNDGAIYVRPDYSLDELVQELR